MNQNKLNKIPCKIAKIRTTGAFAPYIAATSISQHQFFFDRQTGEQTNKAEKTNNKAYRTTCRKKEEK